METCIKRLSITNWAGISIRGCQFGQFVINPTTRYLVEILLMTLRTNFWKWLALNPWPLVLSQTWDGGWTWYQVGFRQYIILDPKFSKYFDNLNCQLIEICNIGSCPGINTQLSNRKLLASTYLKARPCIFLIVLEHHLYKLLTNHNAAFWLVEFMEIWKLVSWNIYSLKHPELKFFICFLICK
jgi:hypothetical protein